MSNTDAAIPQVFCGTRRRKTSRSNPSSIAANIGPLVARLRLRSNIYINPVRNVVIVTQMAQPKPLGKEPIDPMAFFDAVVATLE